MRYILGSIVLLLAFFVGLSPWIIKHTSEVQPWVNAENLDTKTLLLSSIMSGSGSGFQPDFSLIMSDDDYKKKSTDLTQKNITCDGQSQNEDFGRYFGYEKGINNYIRLPLNLTFQKNQSGEFTAITYIFLALVPVLFLFARGRYPWVFGICVTSTLILLFAYGFMGPSTGTDGTKSYPIKSVLDNINTSITNNQVYRSYATTTHGSIFQEAAEGVSIGGTYISDLWNKGVKKPIVSGLYDVKIGSYLSDKLALKQCDINATVVTDKYPLLLGYLILLVLNIIFIASIHFLTRDTEEDKSFRDFTVTLNIYGFLFLISAFGIVWYGILVYFIFFALIGLLAKRFNTFDTEAHKDRNVFTTQFILSVLLFLFISLYFMRTTISHGWTNLMSAGSASNEYKYGLLDQEQALLGYRNDYFVSIATMNLRDTSVLTGVIKKLSHPQLIKRLTQLANDPALFLQDVGQLIPQTQGTKDALLRKDGKIMADYIYDKVLYPSKEEANTGAIYRIGTFMTYLIHKNSQRYFDDSLVFGFDTYFYESNPDITVEKMRKLGLKFLLIDLNAATIDRDPRRVLTQRYEHLLLTMRARNLKLIDTDNLCLRFALDEYKSGKLQTEEEFIDIAGVNYESYRKNTEGQMVQIGRGKKQQQCANYIANSLYNTDAATRYAYLAPIKKALDANEAKNNPELMGRIISAYMGSKYFALYEITDLPAIPVTTPTQSGTVQ